jgi:LuxR family transcriptional regulator, quorum-sensing system regulator BjaR1
MVTVFPGAFERRKNRMNFSSFRGRTFDVIAEISGLTTLRRIAATASRAVAEHGYTSLGISGLPPPTEGADARVVTESTPDGFRAFYIAQRFCLVDHIGAHGRRTRAPFRFSQAPYPRDDSPGRRRFMQALVAFDMREGLVVPIGRPENVPACVWLAGANPDVHAKRCGLFK